MSKLSIDQLRGYAIARSLFTPTTLPKAIQRLGFVQADPIRAPARAQDLTLRHRVKNYRAGDLERHYAKLPIEEDFFVNYGFLPRATHGLMHPREPRAVWTKQRQAQANDVLQFVSTRGIVHPREVDQAFQHGKTKNWFGGSGKASTQLLDDMHYRGLVRIAGRDSGTRLYQARERLAAQAEPDIAIDALIDVIVAKYAPLPERSLSELISYLFRGGVPQWREQRASAFTRTKRRLPGAQVEGQTWYWPQSENPASKRYSLDEELRLLAPFDPIVWDRRRFELFWGWAYRFEAYTPAAKRVRGYYALPLLWRGQCIGWCNAKVIAGTLHTETGFVSGKAPREVNFQRAWGDEVQRLQAFLALADHTQGT
jgi:uncharacterized protein